MTHTIDQLDSDPSRPIPRSSPAPAASRLQDGYGTPALDVRGDGTVVGMPMVVAGSMAFALAVSGYVPVGALMPVLIIAVVGEIIAARWAFRAGHTGQARIFAAFAGFWSTYVGTVLGLTHEWFGVTAEESSLAIAVFMITWLAALAVITVANLDMPLAHTMLLVALDVALVLLLTGTLVGVPELFTAAGIALFVVTALAAYTCLATTGPPALGRALPLGQPVLNPSESAAR